MLTSVKSSDEVQPRKVDVNERKLC